MNKYLDKSVVALSTRQVCRGGMEGDEPSVRGYRGRVTIQIPLIAVGVHGNTSRFSCKAVMNEYVAGPIVTFAGEVCGLGIEGYELSVRRYLRPSAILMPLGAVRRRR